MGHVHCKPLHLPAADSEVWARRNIDTLERIREVDGLPEDRRGTFREVPMVYSRGSVEVGIESVRELVDEVFCAAETGGFTNLVVIMCKGGVAKSDIVMHLRVR
jgi:hypothetical protein